MRFRGKSLSLCLATIVLYELFVTGRWLIPHVILYYQRKQPQQGDLRANWKVNPNVGTKISPAAMAGIATAAINTTTTPLSRSNDSILSTRERISASTLPKYMVASATKPSTRTNSSISKATQTPSSNTVILGFTDHKYVDIARRWYDELSELGYKEHFLVAHDKPALEVLMKHQVRSEDLTPKSTHSLRQDCEKAMYSRIGNKRQYYRRSLFGSRWHYILRQLEQGKNVLLSDVDNVWVKYMDMRELEESDYDVYFAYGGTVPSFPLIQFEQQGFTICGCLSWWRATPSVISFVRALVDECHCNRLHCRCQCDDQRVLNRMLGPGGEYEINWDKDEWTTWRNISSMSRENMPWQGRTGTCTKTSHRVRIWDRHLAYRDRFPPATCPHKSNSWSIMPESTDRHKVKGILQEHCPESDLWDA